MHLPLPTDRSWKSSLRGFLKVRFTSRRSFPFTNIRCLSCSTLLQACRLGTTCYRRPKNAQSNWECRRKRSRVMISSLAFLVPFSVHYPLSPQLLFTLIYLQSSSGSNWLLTARRVTAPRNSAKILLFLLCSPDCCLDSLHLANRWAYSPTIPARRS